MTLDELAAQWEHCTKCTIGEHATHHVLWEVVSARTMEIVKERVRVDMMIIGEGPGLGEQALGRPFVGPAGQLLRSTIQETQPAYADLTICLTNLVACRPYSERLASPLNRAPSKDEITACMPRLASIMFMLKPEMVVAAGVLPDTYMKRTLKMARIMPTYFKIAHPSAIIRSCRKQDREDYRQTFSNLFLFLEKVANAE